MVEAIDEVSAFIGRKKELKLLEDIWQTPGFQMPVIYGRRRVGKTRLLREFARDKPALFYLPGINERENIERFRKMLSEFDIACPSEKWRDMFKAVFRKARDLRFALIIDEFPYLAQSNPDIVTDLQHTIDDPENAAPLFLVLCGSSISFMKDSVLGYQSPLHGRRTQEYDIKPFSIFDSSQFLPKTPFDELCKIYGMVDGTPQYLRLLDAGMDFQKNLRERFLIPTGYLFGDATGLLKQELKDPHLYSQLLSIVSAGPVRLSEIADKMEPRGIERMQCESMVKDLQNIGILKGAAPIGGDNRKKMLYKIDDLFFRFWHRFVPKVALSVNNGRIDAASEYVLKNYSQYMGGVFEKICEQWMLKQYSASALPINIERIGRWWGANPATQKQEEIDMVACDFDGNAMFCECKWWNKKVDAEVIIDLRKKSRLVEDIKDKYFCIFSKSGFSDNCIDYVKECNCGVISIEKMFEADNDILMPESDPQVMMLSF